MRKIFIAILIIISTDIYSQRIPFGFWSNPRVDTLELEAPLLLYPADDTTGMAQSPLLDWDGVVYATGYIVQLSDTSIFTSIAWSDTTGNSKATVELGLTRGSDWYWRVKAYNIFDTSEWSTTFHFTVTTGPALTSPVLVYPGEYATEIPFNPVLDWDSVINADYYKVDISASTNFSSLYWSDTVYTTTATVGTALNGSTQYYWRVIAENPYESKSSDTGSFTTRTPALAAPTLVTPANAATGQSQSPTLVWRRVTNAEFYNVQFTQYDDFSSILLNVGTFDTTKLVGMTLLEGTKWYWRIRAINATDTGSWSSTYSFAVTEGAATARAYYVDPESGKDEYNGRSQSNPWATINKINAYTFNPGDTIRLKGGSSYSGRINKSLSGDSDRITINSYGTGKATINLDSTSSAGINFTFTKKLVLKVSNLIITGKYNAVDTTGGYAYAYGIKVLSTATNTISDINDVTVDSCEISKVLLHGISVQTTDVTRKINCTITNNIISEIRTRAVYLAGIWYSNVNVAGNTIYNIRGNANSLGQGIKFELCKNATVSRNLIYNIGNLASNYGNGVGMAVSKNIIVRHNEIYGIKSNSGGDGDPIDFDFGSDSCIAEYNYVHNSDGFLLISDNAGSFAPYWAIYYPSYDARADSSCSDHNIIRYNIVKNCGLNTAGGAGSIVIYGNNPLYPPNGNKIYNNTIIQNKLSDTVKRPYGIGILTTRTDSTKIYNNIIIGDSAKSIRVDTITNQKGLVIKNNCYWTRSNNYYRVKWGGTVYTSIDGWIAASSMESTAGAKNALTYNPLLTNPFTLRDTINNAYTIDTLTAFKFQDASIMRNTGLQYYNWNTATADYYGRTINYNTAGYDIGAYEDTVSTYTYQTIAKRWIGRDTSLASQTDRYIKDSLILRLNADTILSKMDLLYIFAGPTRYAARFNILRDSNNITEVNSPTFTAYQGYNGNGSTSYLNTNWKPSNGVNYTLNNASYGAYSRTDTNSNTAIMGVQSTSSDYIYLKPRNSNSFQASINQGTFLTTPNTSSIGWFVGNRTSHNAYKYFKNGTALASFTDTSAALATDNLYILGYDAAGSATVQQPTVRQISAVYTGSSMSDYMQGRLSNNINWYMTRVGANKLPPLAPSLVSPTNGEDSVVFSAILDWADVYDATSYTLIIDDTSTFASPAATVSGITSSYYQPSGHFDFTIDVNKTYYWKVLSVNSYGTSSYSSAYSFSSTNTIPAAPTLLAPSNTEDSVSLTDTLDWSGPEHAATYHLQADDNSDFSSLIGEVTGLTNSQYIVGGTNPGATGVLTLNNNYLVYWRIRALNSDGTAGAWSSTFSFSTPSTWQTESLNLFARFENGVSSQARKDLIDSLIVKLKTDTIWSKLDVFYSFAAEDTSQANQNWVSSNYRIVRSGSTKPTLTANAGYTGDGSTGYLNTQWNPFSNGSQFTQNDASYGAYIRTDADNTKPVMGAHDAAFTKTIYLQPRNSNNMIGGINDGGTGGKTLSNSSGFILVNRYNSTTKSYYKDGSQISTDLTLSSTGMTAKNIYVLAYNANGTASGFDTRQISIVYFGSSFTAYRQAVFNRHIEWYLNRLNALISAPSAPALLSPSNSATGISVATNYDWNDVGANYYRIEIDDDIAFGSPYYAANCIGSEEFSANIGDLANNTTYYWRVRGVNSIGTGSWSSTYSFTTTP